MRLVREQGGPIKDLSCEGIIDHFLVKPRPKKKVYKVMDGVPQVGGVELDKDRLSTGRGPRELVGRWLVHVSPSPRPVAPATAQGTPRQGAPALTCPCVLHPGGG